MNIVVLCGGTSTEREISIVSGTGICKALREKGHRAILLDVFFGVDSIDMMDAFPESYDVDAAASYIRENDPDLEAAVKNPGRGFFGPNVITLCRMADIVFMALHGENGENGKVQAAFDLRKIKYTGTGYIGSALSMDKKLTKTMLKAGGVPVPEGFTMTRDDYDTELQAHGLDFPVVVKVCCGGSSVGVYIVHNQEEYEKAVHDGFLLEPEIIVEQYVRGREFSIGVIDGKSLPIIEIAPKQGFYDYKNKYTAGSTVETCPAALTPEQTKKMRGLAEQGYKALMIESYARLDFLMGEDGSMYCLESNTLPGMTPTSLMPQEAASLGVDFGSLCEKLIEVSMAKYQK
ncbi:MAG: D-alanine--D-alanine ligase [Lachnospiraceae bacterium]|nr:D-alanine--D-alanine ligase [Lachnospiraceae bacterium]